MKVEGIRGKNGYTVGSPKYWHNLNLVGVLKYIKIKELILYHDTLSLLPPHIADIIHVVYQDLTKNIIIIKFIPQSQRDELKNMLIGLAEISNKIVSGGNIHQLNDCVGILSLTAVSAQYPKGFSYSEIEAGTRLVKSSSSKLSVAKKKEILRDTLQHDINYATKGNINNLLFVKELMDGKTIAYLKNVDAKIQYTDTPAKFTGKGGCKICSEEYMNQLIHGIFPLMPRSILGCV